MLVELGGEAGAVAEGDEEERVGGKTRHVG